MTGMDTLTVVKHYSGIKGDCSILKWSNKKIAFILCNGYISFVGFQGHLMGFSLHKWSSTDAHYKLLLEVVTFGISVMILKSVVLSLTVSTYPILFTCTQRRVQSEQCYFTVQITGSNFDCSS